MTTTKTWKELKAEGVRRCCATFTNGKRCARRAVERYGYAWCGKHGPTFERIDRDLSAVIKKESQS